MASPLTCPKCHRWVRAEALNTFAFGPCAHCATPLQVDVFPALFRAAAVGQSGEAVVMDGESTCFQHAEKRAVMPCGSCGRFMCALCDCELNGAHFCPTCLEKGKTTGTIRNLDDKRTRYDSIAFSLAVLPIVLIIAFWPFTFVTAPIALFVALRHWKTPRSLVRPAMARVRSVIAIVFASVQIVAWIVAVVFIAREFGNG